MVAVYNNVFSNDLKYYKDLQSDDLKMMLGETFTVEFIKIGDVQCSVWFNDALSESDRIGLLYNEKEYYGNVIIECQDNNELEKILNELNYISIYDLYINEEYTTLIEFENIIYFELEDVE